MRRISVVIAVFVWSLASMGIRPAGAATFAEVGDAGPLPATAQNVTGVEPVTEITGTLGGAPPGEDMYRLCLAGNGTFSASTVGTPGTFSDTQLFLFDAAGNGVYANDDAPGGGFRSTLPASDPLTPAVPGIYYLAISVFNDDPVSAGGLIFPNAPFSGVFGPTGPGGGSPITGWTAGGGTPGTYTIVLTGAYPCDAAVFCPALTTPTPGAIVGTAGHDSLTGTAGNDVIFGLGGNDFIAGGGGADILVAGTGNDFVGGGDGDDIICGGSGNDQLFGDAGADDMAGEAGYDNVNGGTGNDRLSGGSENDSLDGGGGVNVNDGGAGADSCANPAPPVATTCSP